MASKLRWGIIGSGKISQDFAYALGGVEKAQIVAVGARELESAKKFASEHSIPKYYGSYEELVKDPEVQVVYIGTIHPAHHENTLLALKHGKHVLCEKPLAMNEKQVKEMVELARSSGLFLMEAMWTRCFPSVIKIKELINSGALGEIKYFTADFGFIAPPGFLPRLSKLDLGGGALLDIGIYVVAFAFLVFGGKPTSVQALGHFNEEGSDVSVAINLGFKPGQFAQVFATQQAYTGHLARIVGTKGQINIPPPFHAPKEFTLVNLENIQDRKITTEEFPAFPDHLAPKWNFRGGSGMIYEAEHVTDCILKGLKESPLFSLDESLEIVKVQDQIRKQIGGPIYAADKE